jgi:AraC-like DNA-binding protein
VDEYLPFRSDEETPIIVERVTQNGSVGLHKHRFYEFVLVSRGSCVHEHDRREAVLLPGDVFLLPPGESHAFRLGGDVTLYNLQFYPERLTSTVPNLQERWDTILHAVSLGRGEARGGTDRSDADINAQGVVHLDDHHRGRVEGMLEEIVSEQMTQRVGFELIKHAYLEIILVILVRVQQEQLPRPGENRSRKRQIVAVALDQMERDLTQPLDIDVIAADACVTPNYFRAVFKETTGLSPTNYLNRLRVTQAITYLRGGAPSIAAAAEAVGIGDPNYFSRLFKKIVGHPPSRSGGSE